MSNCRLRVDGLLVAPQVFALSFLKLVANEMYLPVPYFQVYALVMGSDWLQGPFLFSLYHDE